MNNKDNRSLKDIRIDVVKHDLTALGMRCQALARSLGPDMTISDAWVIVEAVNSIQRALLDTASEDLTTIIDELSDQDDIPF